MKDSGHRLRHEMKYFMNEKDYFNLCSRLKLVTEPDSYMKDNGYLVSSVFF